MIGLSASLSVKPPWSAPMAIVLSGGASADTSSSGNSRMATPRAAATSRAEAVTMEPIGTRNSPLTGTSCAVMTRFIELGPLYSVDMQVASPELRLPSRLLDDDEYFEFCVAHPDQRFERTPEGEVIAVPPVGWEGAGQELEVAAELRVWAKLDGRGRAFGPSAEYILPTRAAYSPDAS